MKRFFLTLGLLMLLLIGSQPAIVAAQSSSTYVVQPGDTLTGIAARHSLGIGQLASANGLTVYTWVYVGQRLVIPGGQPSSSTAPATGTPSTSGGTQYEVKSGDTLLTIAVRHGVTVSQLATANSLSWNTWVYIGQRLVIPGTATAPSESPTETVEPGGSYVVKAGDNLFRIALRHGVALDTLKAVNGLTSNTIYIGQRLTIPGTGSAPAVTPTDPTPPQTLPGASGEKWIDVNLSTQTITAYSGQTPVYSALVSTGLWGTPTVVGTFKIYVKYLSTPMSGPGYYLPGVPHTMYLYYGTQYTHADHVFDQTGTFAGKTCTWGKVIGLTKFMAIA